MNGLSQLADVHKELTDPAGGHYPVRRRGERRELRPNWTGIAWLEAQTLEHTEPLAHSRPVYANDSDEPVWYTWLAARMANRLSASAPRHCVRPMIELVDDYQLPEHRMSGSSTSHRPCPDCDDWSRTARCAEHAEQGPAAVSGDEPARRYGEQLVTPRPAAPHFTTDADGVLHAQQGDSYDAARDLARAIRDEFRIFLGGGA